MCDKKSSFEALELPEETDDGFWVITVQAEDYRQLHSNGKVYDGIDGIDDNGASAYFDSEEFAIDTAVEYYHNHGRNYFDFDINSSQSMNEGSLVMNFE